MSRTARFGYLPVGVVLVAIFALPGCGATPSAPDPQPLRKGTTTLKDPYAEGARQFKLHNWSEALSAYTTALEEKPNDGRSPAAMYYQAFCHEQLGNKAEAIAGYKAFLKKYPKHANLQKAKGRLSKKFGETVE